VEKKEFWSASTDEERFHGRYDSREEAIASYPEDDGLWPDEGFYVGRIREIDIAACCSGMGEAAIERVIERMTDWVGDLCEDWPGAVTKEQETELDNAISEAVIAWVEKYCRPTFYQVVDVEYVCRDQEEAGADGKL
jgi:hypothetical protein